MSVLQVVHGFSSEHKSMTVDVGFAPADFLGSSFSIALLRRAEYKAKQIGIDPFYNGLYKAWIHPYAVADLLSDISTPLEGILGDSDLIRLSNTLFVQTTTVKSTFIFGENSDLTKFEYIWAEETV